MTVSGYVITRFPDLVRIRDGIATIPNGAEHEKDIVDKIKAGTANAIEIHHEGKPVAEFVFEIFGEVLFVLASYALTKEGRSIDVPENVQYIIEKIARDKGCIAVEFQTARIALIKRAYENLYHVKHVTMRKSLC